MSQASVVIVNRFYTKANQKAYELLKWVKKDSIIINPVSDEPVFEQKNVEFPEDWSLNAINIVAQKYFAGTPGTPERERSLKVLVDRVVNTMRQAGEDNGYFADKNEAETFSEELKYILASQRAAFNSPVWFNVGVMSRKQQSSACFILGIEDTMESILGWYVEEGTVFKGGSGAGINLSPLRSSQEQLSASGGKASGPVSFMRGADASAGAIKSGGKTRRAAKMVILNVDHPDIEEFIWCKALEERKARVLAEAGFDMDIDGKDSFSVQYQNANNSVRVTDDFMKAVVEDKDWDLRAVKDDRVIKTVKAKELFNQFCQATWECADPGMQFDDTVNGWHTTPNAGRINASNPCSEFMSLDYTACNLASINLMKYLRPDGSFDIEAFKHTITIILMAQEILIDYSYYPIEKIGNNTKIYRALGLGYANLGAMLMAQGIAYDSDEGRAQATAITALMTGQAYGVSAKIAGKVGAFSGFHKDRESMLKVLKQHRKAFTGIRAELVNEELLSAAASCWEETLVLAESNGLRNCQVTLLAPTGTIGLMMDCDTTGIEPDLGLVKSKKLVGGGNMSIVNQTVPRALRALGYTKSVTDEIIAYIDQEKTIIGAPSLDKKHLNVFACSMGDNSIHYLGHVKMMAAVQPFLSGAISKTVNLPQDTTVEEIAKLHIDAWKMGIKAIAIYRDNCKVTQPVTMGKKEGQDDSETAKATTGLAESFIVKGAVRRVLPRRRTSHTYKFYLSDLKGFFTVGEYEDGAPGELFISVAKQGSTLSGLMNSFAISVSHGLQYGVPLKSYVRTLMGTSFAPAGITDDKEIRTATSIIDYIFKRLALDYLSFDDRLELGLASIDDMPQDQITLLKDSDTVTEDKTNMDSASQKDSYVPNIAKDLAAPICYNCGNQTQRAGSCYVCSACGSTTGCS